MAAPLIWNAVNGTEIYEVIFEFFIVIKITLKVDN